MHAQLARFVALVPYLEDSALQKRQADVWTTSAQVLAMAAGDEEEHAHLLVGYFLEIGQQVSVLVLCVCVCVCAHECGCRCGVQGKGESNCGWVTQMHGLKSEIMYSTCGCTPRVDVLSGCTPHVDVNHVWMYCLDVHHVWMYCLDERIRMCRWSFLSYRLGSRRVVCS